MFSYITKNICKSTLVYVVFTKLCGLILHEVFQINLLYVKLQILCDFSLRLVFFL